MRLDRYSGKPPKYLVFKAETAMPAFGAIADLGQALLEARRKGETFTLSPETAGAIGDAIEKIVEGEVPAEDCFVLKRQDVNTAEALKAYSISAFQHADTEFSDDVDRLIADWEKTTEERGDAKRPD